MDFSIIARAGLHKTEFAVITGVARASLHEYIRGRRQPHQLTERHLLRAAQTLETWIAKGALPITDTSRKARRKIVIGLKKQINR